MSEVEQAMHATYGRSKSYWGLVVWLWAGSVVLAGVAQTPLPAWMQTVLAVAGLLAAIAAYGARWRAESLYQTAEQLRSVRMLADGLGEDGDPVEIARLLAAGSDRPSTDPPSVGPYYTSEHSQGWHRVVHNVLESAFYTERLARIAGWWCTLVVISAVVVALVVLFCVADAGGSHAAASIAFGAVSVAATGTIADLARAYFGLAAAAGQCVDRAKSIMAQTEPPLRDAINIVSSYDAALANAPPIPGFIYRSEQTRLDALWKTARAVSPTRK